MLSRNNSNVYPVNEDVTEFDLNTDVEEYNYNGRNVYRGNLDPEFSDQDIQVYWLYDDNKRVGLVEHTKEKHDCYWFRDNAFSSLLQEDWTEQERSIWSYLSEAAYDDFQKNNWTINDLKTKTQLAILTPQDIIEYQDPPVSCIRCNSNQKHKNCIYEKKNISLDIFTTLFVDSDGILYIPPSDTQIYATLRRRGALGGSLEVTTDAGGVVGIGTVSSSSSS